MSITDKLTRKYKTYLDDKCGSNTACICSENLRHNFRPFKNIKFKLSYFTLTQHKKHYCIIIAVLEYILSEYKHNRQHSSMFKDDP